MLLAGDLRKAAAAAFAPGQNRAVEFGRAVRPDNHSAAIAARQRVGPNDRTLADDSFFGVLHGGILALETAAKQNAAAAGLSTGIDLRTIRDLDTFARDLHVAAFGAGGIEGTGIASGAAGSFQENGAAFAD